MMATDGILGFGQSSTSMISQLASAKKARKIFAHCLDSQNGGIFAIGNVVQPKVQTTPLVANQSHYNINLENIQVGKDKITADELRSHAVIDSGTTLAYLPQKLYDPLISKVRLYGFVECRPPKVVNIAAVFSFDYVIGRSAERGAIESPFMTSMSDPSILKGIRLNTIIKNSKCNVFNGAVEAIIAGIEIAYQFS
ncbi:hypothetical protein Syun_025895 [Stephania yunnanensis]|uniref:Xylanase inhibitor N-terminal domain-containing protein n=1 Tax=Stephania yunnanensis TaxID=152371 RepID=A0AAP0HWJ7_9MAGN